MLFSLLYWPSLPMRLTAAELFSVMHRRGLRYMDDDPTWMDGH